MLHVLLSVQRTVVMGMDFLRPLRYAITRHSASTTMTIIAIARRSATPPAAPIATRIPAAAAISVIGFAVSEFVTVPVMPELVVGPRVWQAMQERQKAFAYESWRSA